MKLIIEFLSEYSMDKNSLISSLENQNDFSFIFKNEKVDAQCDYIIETEERILLECPLHDDMRFEPSNIITGAYPFFSPTKLEKNLSNVLAYHVTLIQTSAKT